LKKSPEKLNALFTYKTWFYWGNFSQTYEAVIELDATYKLKLTPASHETETEALGAGSLLHWACLGTLSGFAFILFLCFSFRLHFV
jgi:hypothetical protein